MTFASPKTLPPAEALAPSTVSPVRFRRVARAVRAIILVGVCLLAANTAATWIFPGYARNVIETAVKVTIVGPLTPATRVTCALWELASDALLIVALWHLWNLFGEYLQGRVFSLRALASLRGFARWMLATALLSPPFRVVLSVLASWQNGPGQREFVLNLSSDDYLLLLFGAVILAISSVMAEAARIAEDNEGFV